MAGYPESTAPKDARMVLEGFISQTEGSEPVQSFDELEAVVSSKVTSALATVILENGRPSKYPESENLAILESKDGRRMVQGVVKSGFDNDEPTTVYLAEFKRRALRFKRTRWIMVGIQQGVGHGAAVDDGHDFYMPSLHSDETIKIYRDEIGECGSPKTGLEMAGEAIRKRPRALKSFLEVTAALTKDLVRVVPTQ